MTDLVFTKTVDMATDLDWRILRSEAEPNEIVQSGNKYSASYLGTFKLSNTGASGAITDLRISREGIVILEGKAVDMQVDDTLRIIEGGGGQRRSWNSSCVATMSLLARRVMIDQCRGWYRSYCRWLWQ